MSKTEQYMTRIDRFGKSIWFSADCEGYDAADALVEHCAGLGLPVSVERSAAGVRVVEDRAHWETRTRAALGL